MEIDIHVVVCPDFWFRTTVRSDNLFLDYTKRWSLCESWKIAAHVHRRLNSTVSKMLSKITVRSTGIAEEARTPTENILMNMRDRRWSWLGRGLRMDEDRLVRKVFLNCVQPTKESLYGDIPDLDVEKASEIARDREKWKKIRP